MTNTYDALGRVQKKTIGLNTPYETTITYVDVGTSKTSGLIASYQNGNDDPYLYTYDDNGNNTYVRTFFGNRMSITRQNTRTDAIDGMKS